jgi:hypothetical protein
MNKMRLMLLAALLCIASCSAANPPLASSASAWPDRPPADETPCQGPIHVC